jgi:hypothetical protein
LQCKVRNSYIQAHPIVKRIVRLEFTVTSFSGPSSGRSIGQADAPQNDVREPGRFHSPDAGVDMANTAAERGLWKLLLKLPTLRGRLQMLVARDPDVRSMCEAFDEATSTLERLKTAGNGDPKLILEYTELCASIENEVADLCNRADGSR